MFEMIPVTSSNVQALGYDPATWTLAVEFNNGTAYHYQNVGQDVFEGFLNAPSKGSFLNEVIKKGGYPCTRIR